MAGARYTFTYEDVPNIGDYPGTYKDELGEDHENNAFVPVVEINVKVYCPHCYNVNTFRIYRRKKLGDKAMKRAIHDELDNMYSGKWEGY